MNIDYRERIAIIYALSIVAGADLNFSEEERTLRSKVAIFLGVTNEDNNAVRSMDLSECCSIMLNMSYENKRFASAVLVQMMMADGVDMQIEHSVIERISQLADLPFISSEESYNYLKKIGIIGNKVDLLWGSLRYGVK